MSQVIEVLSDGPVRLRSSQDSKSQNKAAKSFASQSESQKSNSKGKRYKPTEAERLKEDAIKVAKNILIKTEETDGDQKKKLTRGALRRMRNNNKDAEEGKYEERDISDT